MRTSRAGYTMLEVAIVVTILVTILGTAITAMASTQKAFEQTVSSGIVNRNASRTLNRVAQVMAGARQDAVIISADLGSVRFQSATGWNNGSMTWGNETQLLLEYEPEEMDNGLDDDGDGFIDECQVVLVEDAGEPEERRVVLVKSVREFLEGELPDGIDNNGNTLEDERGLVFQMQDGVLTLRLTLQKADPDGHENLRTLTTTVGMRN